MHHIAVSGELGSGKSAVARELSRRTGADVVSTGAIHRRIAASRGQSALETNLVAEEDASIDELIDGELVRMGTEDDRIVFDSRMAWHFVPGALKVHLLVDPRIAAERMLQRGVTSVEGYASVRQAQDQAEERHASEQRRFFATYEVDIDRLRNYDVVIDTSLASVAQVASLVEHAIEGRDGQPRLLLSPDRILPTMLRGAVDGAAVDADAAAGRPPGDADDDPDMGARTVVHGERAGNWPDVDGPMVAVDDGSGQLVDVAYDRPRFMALSRHRVVARARQQGALVVPARLVAEGSDEVVDGLTAAELHDRRVTRDVLASWRMADTTA